MIKYGIDALQEAEKMMRSALQSDYTNKLEDTFNNIESEIHKVKVKYPHNFNSLHEAYAVIKEEIDELWDEIKKKDTNKENIKMEAIQSAAMLCRLLVELV